MGWPTPGHRVALIDDDGNEVEDGVEGEIALYGRPPSLFTRYWYAAEETALAFRGNWYLTGDRATRDEDGSIWFTGRADDVILSAAYRIGPFEVESALLEHPAVAESAVIGKPDAERGQIVKAFVVLRPGHQPTKSLAAELKRHAKKITAPYKYPREIEFVTELPKTTSGKIRRVELRRLADAGTGPATPPAPQPVPAAPPETETGVTVPVEEVVVVAPLEVAVAAQPEASDGDVVPREDAAARTREADEAVARFLEEAAERRRAAAERQRAEESRLARQTELERDAPTLEPEDGERRAEQQRAEQQRAAEAAALRAAEELQRRRDEEGARRLLAEAEQRRRVALRLEEHVRARRTAPAEMAPRETKDAASRDGSPALVSSHAAGRRWAGGHSTTQRREVESLASRLSAHTGCAAASRCASGGAPGLDGGDEAGDNVHGGSCGARRRWLGSPGGVQLHSRRRRVLRDGPETDSADVRGRRRRDRAPDVRPGRRGRRALGARAAGLRLRAGRPGARPARQRAGDDRHPARRDQGRPGHGSLPGAHACTRSRLPCPADGSLAADRRPKRRGGRRRDALAPGRPSSTCSFSTRPRACSSDAGRLRRPRSRRRIITRSSSTRRA